jgi:alkylated DNA repair dioxygenase AlkB
MNSMTIPKVEPALTGAEIYLAERFAGAEEASRLMNLLLFCPQWSRRTFMGRPVPRSEIYMGDRGTAYRYSNRTYTPSPWIPEVDGMRHKIQEATGACFNSALLNLYRDGRDSVAAHSDDEPEYGNCPTIASLSLGAPRLFRMRQIGGEGRWEITLRHGDLLVMAGQTQHNWRHAVPKDATCFQPRINLTFRRVIDVHG